MYCPALYAGMATVISIITPLPQLPRSPKPRLVFTGLAIWLGARLAAGLSRQKVPEQGEHLLSLGLAIFVSEQTVTQSYQGNPRSDAALFMELLQAGHES